MKNGVRAGLSRLPGPYPTFDDVRRPYAVGLSLPGQLFVNRSIALVAALLALCCAPAQADPGYYVVTVYDDPGARTADFRYWTVKRPGSPAVTWPEVGLGWNVNGRWYTHVLASYIGSSGSATRLSTLNWQNDLLLTQGQYPVDLALHTLLVKSKKASKGDALELGPVLQTDIGRTQVNVNAFFEHRFGEAVPTPTQLKYQWQLRHRWKPWLHFGVQGFGEVGAWNDWAPRDDQSHRIGPALFGAVPVGEDSLAWQAAYLTGSTNARHGKMFSMRVKYDF